MFMFKGYAPSLFIGCSQKNAAHHILDFKTVMYRVHIKSLKVALHLQASESVALSPTSQPQSQSPVFVARPCRYPDLTLISIINISVDKSLERQVIVTLVN